MLNKKINISEKFTKFSDHWSPRVIAQMNNYQFKLVKVAGEFVWHDHPETDEVFIVIEGTLIMTFQNGEEILTAGEMIVIPKGVAHKPSAISECKVIIIEPNGVINTGNNDGSLTAENDIWI